MTKQLDIVQETLPTVERNGPWLRVCQTTPEGESCRYEQKVAASNGDEVTLAFLGAAPGERSGPAIALFYTPLYVLLTPGMALIFDGEPSGSIGFRACTPRGCIASAVLEGALRSRLAYSNRVAIRFTTQASETVTADFSLSGSAAILNAM